MGKTIENPRSVAIDRAKAAGYTTHTTFAAAGSNGVRSIELANIEKGQTVTLPSVQDLVIIKQPIAGSTNTVDRIITEEGLDFYPSVLTRGATPLAGGTRVKPSGTVVEKCQTYSRMDDFYAKELAGKKITFSDYTEVVARGFNGEATRNVKVWKIDFAG